jgi:tRNA A37 threonylcarbamoyladenosine modification protein TsaB
VHGVCSLDVLAHQAGTGAPLTVVSDARRREVFWASYDANGERIAGPGVSRPADVAASLIGRAVGPGALLYADIFGSVAGPEELSAGALCMLAADWLHNGRGFLPPLPVYLRRPDTAPPTPAKRVLQP